MSDSLAMLLLRVQQLQADCLLQADSYNPTVADVADWLTRIHGLPDQAIEPAGLDPALPRQLLGLPLFRHFVIKRYFGGVRHFIRERLALDQQLLFDRLGMPAQEFDQVLHQWNDCLWHIQSTLYKERLRQINGDWQHVERYQASMVIARSTPGDALQFMTLCCLPPLAIQNRKMIDIAGLKRDGEPVLVEAYPQGAAAGMLREPKPVTVAG